MPWDPVRYDKFKEERFATFEDLFALIKVRNGMSAVDLGCGIGELTRRLADRLPGSTVAGIDNSPGMLEKARAQQRPGLTFTAGDISALNGRWDLVFSHAAIHWLDNHAALIPRLMKHVNPGGQLAVQEPSNHKHPAQKYHNIQVYGTGCIQKRCLAKRENHQSAQQHDLPDLKFEFPELPYSNEDQNNSQSYDGNISAEHTRSRNSQCYNYLGSLCQNSI